MQRIEEAIRKYREVRIKQKTAAEIARAGFSPTIQQFKKALELYFVVKPQRALDLEEWRQVGIGLTPPNFFIADVINRNFPDRNFISTNDIQNTAIRRIPELETLLNSPLDSYNCLLFNGMVNGVMTYHIAYLQKKGNILEIFDPSGDIYRNDRGEFEGFGKILFDRLRESSTNRALQLDINEISLQPRYEQAYMCSRFVILRHLERDKSLDDFLAQFDGKSRVQCEGYVMELLERKGFNQAYMSKLLKDIQEYHSRAEQMSMYNEDTRLKEQEMKEVEDKLIEAKSELEAEQARIRGPTLPTTSL